MDGVTADSWLAGRISALGRGASKDRASPVFRTSEGRLAPGAARFWLVQPSPRLIERDNASPHAT